MSSVLGIHHITAIASDPQRNLDFYAGVLGLRFVKRTVNFDDPHTYHFYYGDATGAPGTILTFFPWPGARQGRQGTGQAAAIAFAIPPAATGFWLQRLVHHGIPHDGPARRAGPAGVEQVIAFRDHDGLMLELVADETVTTRDGWETKSITAENAIRSFHRVTLWVEEADPTRHVLTHSLGFREVGEHETTRRYASGDGCAGTLVDVRAAGGFVPALGGAGTVHHVAWRAENDAAELELRDAVAAAGMHPTPVIDRNYFNSVYFREPGRVLFEIATDSPGFAVDEPVDQLGNSLKLPPQYEPHRAEIESALPEITVP
jgi:glyoxalase family protein